MFFSESMADNIVQQTLLLDFKNNKKFMKISKFIKEFFSAHAQKQTKCNTRNVLAN